MAGKVNMDEVVTKTTAFAIQDILKCLPHRYPFLLVDRIIEARDDISCIGIKNVSFNEPQFQGHFPNQPVMPGVLLIEGMAQTAGAFCIRAHAKANDGPPPLVYFMTIDRAKFRKPVVPGDTLFIEVELLVKKRAIMKARGRCLVNGEVVSEADMMFGIVDT